MQKLFLLLVFYPIPPLAYSNPSNPIARFKAAAGKGEVKGGQEKGRRTQRGEKIGEGR